ncbi:MAG: ribosomal protein S18-alanine N-acetyltransferase [Oscillospiraceae bacterium]|nr:ribosomal protein S18-alanine N-acetyltransferase [Oscillospiraceae bacterium]
MLFRPMKPSDLADIIEIEKTCFTADAWSEEDFIYRMNEDTWHFVNLTLEDNGKVAAYLSATVVADEMNIDSVAVSPDYRRKGYASKLINLAIEKARTKFVMLEVRESNTPAITLYKSLGFKEVGLRKNYYERPVENAVLMTKCN